MDLGIKDKVAIVTGAASKKGIGHAIALALAGEGAHVMVADIAYEGVQALADDIKAMGRKALAIKVDQSVYDEVRDAVSQTAEEMGNVDILVNCAALTSNFGTITKMELAKWAHETDVNLHGPYYWIREALPIMKKNNWGRIVNISSVAGIFGTTGVPSYAVSKGGLHALTIQAARENASKGIMVNALALGIIATEIYERPEFSPETVERLVKHIPLGRMGEPSEVADVVAFLCSERASYITGTVIPVEGCLINSI